VQNETSCSPYELLEDPRVVLSHRISEIVNSRANLNQILRKLIQIVGEITQCDACLVYLADPASGDVVLRASQLSHPDEIGNVRLKLGEGVAGWAAERQKIVALPRDASSDLRFKQFSSLMEDTFEALLSVPLVSQGELIGVLNVHHREPHLHTMDEILLMTLVGQQMGSAIALSHLQDENVRLQAEAQETRRQLEERKLVERAKGILQERYQLTEEQAYLRLRNESRRTRKPIRELAKAILLVEGMAHQK
jgi:two-component system, response regulator PdtaR